MQSFSERMALAREIAADRRYKGQSTGKIIPRVSKQYAHRGTWTFLSEEMKREFKADCREILNDYRQSVLNYHDDPDTWGDF